MMRNFTFRYDLFYNLEHNKNTFKCLIVVTYKIKLAGRIF
jgi:hypothetical protein